MSPERFEHLLQLASRKLSKRDTRFRKSIPTAEHLELTLRFLASSDGQKSLSFACRIGTTTVSNIIKETYILLKEVSTEKFVKPTRCKRFLWEILKKFVICQTLKVHWMESIFKLRHLQTLEHSSITINDAFSIVLLAICDANYCFTLVDIGQFGSNNDSRVLANSSIAKQFEESRMQFTAGRHVPGCPIARCHTIQLAMRYSHSKLGLWNPFLENLPKNNSLTATDIPTKTCDWKFIWYTQSPMADLQ